jgi:transcription elongation factor Elf1
MTMPDQLEAAITCPYCGESLVLLVDPSVPDQAYVEDCAVCCQPMAVRAEVGDDGSVRIGALREDDT